MYSPRTRTPTSRISAIYIVALIAICSLVYLYVQVSNIGNTTVSPQNIYIDKGDTLTTLPTKIGLDIPDWQYKIWLKYYASPVELQIGQYSVGTGATLSTVLVDTLSTPVHIDMTITILPGWNIYDIDEYMVRKKIGTAGEIISLATATLGTYQKKYTYMQGVSSLEGFLYPDTYRLAKDATIQDVLDIMVRTFDKKLGKAYTDMGSTRYRTLVMASILEREERNKKNQPIVAGILFKRLDEGIPLGADATVCYGYAKSQSGCTPEFIGEKIYNKNPYNTRNTKGLPPTPICSVSVDTFTAAASPEASVYYFYLHDMDGYIHYGRTNAEHVVNKQKYL